MLQHRRPWAATVAALRGKLGVPAERDLWFEADAVTMERYQFVSPRDALLLRRTGAGSTADDGRVREARRILRPDLSRSYGR